MAAYDPPSPVSMPGTRSRTLSSSSNRLPAKWSSQTSLNNPSRAPSRAPSPSSQTRGKSRRSSTFQSPLFRLRRAPLLQVFVPSPDGDWLSDASVLECEAELKRAGVLHLMRAGDVVWDAAVGDEANVGRLVWDGSYLIVSTTYPCQGGALSLSLVGPRLHLFAGRRSSSLLADTGIPSFLFPSCHPDNGNGQPSCADRYRTLGRSDTREPAASARQAEDGHVRSAVHSSAAVADHASCAAGLKADGTPLCDGFIAPRSLSGLLREGNPSDYPCRTPLDRALRRRVHG